MALLRWRNAVGRDSDTNRPVDKLHVPCLGTDFWRPAHNFQHSARIILRTHGQILHPYVPGQLRYVTCLFIVCVLIWIPNVTMSAPMQMITLPEPRLHGRKSFEDLLTTRRSVREFDQSRSLMLNEVSQLLWAAQGITDLRGLRTAPSAGALYPLEVHVVVGAVHGLDAGVYRYQVREHRLVQTLSSDRRAALARAALGQSWVADGAIALVISAIYERTTQKYGQRGVRYVHMEVGHVSQNVFLQAVSLGLKTVVIGAFNDNSVKNALKMDPDEHPLCIMPISK